MINATIKISKRTLLVFALIIGIVSLLVLEIFINFKEQTNISLNSFDERISYVNSLGYSAKEEKESEIFIPKEVPKVFEDYNKKQQESGFNLLQFKGKTLKRYTYSCPDNVTVTLFLYNNILVGREVKNN